MANDSSTGGYLQPTVDMAPPAEDKDLDYILQDLIVGISNLPPTLVRRRWQSRPPRQPEADVDWCAFGVMSMTPDDNPALIHHGENEGYTEEQRHLRVVTLASFYGPNSSWYAGLLRDGIEIPQNRDTLRATSGLALVATRQIVELPELINQLWVRRADLNVEFNRQITRYWPIKNLKSAQGTIITGTGPQRTLPWKAGN